MPAKHYHKDVQVRRLGLDYGPHQKFSYLSDAEYGRRPYQFGWIFRFLGEFASLTRCKEWWFFWCFIREPYFFRLFLLLVTHQFVGKPGSLSSWVPAILGLTFWSPIRFTFVFFSAFFRLFSPVFSSCLQCQLSSPTLWSSMPMAWLLPSPPTSSFKCDLRSWTQKKRTIQFIPGGCIRVTFLCQEHRNAVLGHRTLQIDDLYQLDVTACDTPVTNVYW